jgi:hypothetical protein
MNITAIDGKENMRSGNAEWGVGNREWGMGVGKRK